jgi:hypothetical protein
MIRKRRAPGYLARATGKWLSLMEAAIGFQPMQKGFAEIERG